MLWALADRFVDEVIEFYRSREQAERALRAVLARRAGLDGDDGGRALPALRSALAAEGQRPSAGRAARTPSPTSRPLSLGEASPVRATPSTEIGATICAPVRVVRAFPLLLALCAVFASAQASSGAAPAAVPDVSVFYYPWYGTPARDGGWVHWTRPGYDLVRVELLPGPGALLELGRARRPGPDARDRGRRDPGSRLLVVGLGLPRGPAAPARDLGGPRWRTSASPPISSRTPAATSSRCGRTSSTCRRSGSGGSSSTTRSTSPTPTGRRSATASTASSSSPRRP